MESQDEEWKEAWKDDYLDTICAFANGANGGKLIIGKKDNGEIVGVRNAKKLLEEIPNTVKNLMNFYPSVEAVSEGGKTLIVITVEPQEEGVDLRGSFFIRSGSTTVKLGGRQLKRFLLLKSDMSWTDLPAEKIKIEDLSQEAIDLFLKKGNESGRMSPEAAASDRESLLRRYDLMDDEGLRISGAVLFHPTPVKVSYATGAKIGAFDEDDRLLRDDRIRGPIISQPDRVMRILLDKYVQGRYELKGLQNLLVYPYPEKALREAVVNATVHRDYSDNMDTSVRVYPDRVEILNPGWLPEGWTEDNVLNKHSSKPMNPAIAHAFYDMGYSEGWGSGIPMMQRECEAMGLPHPEYNVSIYGVEIVFKLPPKEDEFANALKVKGLNDTESKVYQAICEGSVTTLSEISEASGVSKSSVKRALGSLTKKELIIRAGNNRTGKWVQK